MITGFWWSLKWRWKCLERFIRKYLISCLLLDKDKVIHVTASWISLIVLLFVVQLKKHRLVTLFFYPYLIDLNFSLAINLAHSLLDLLTVPDDLDWKFENKSNHWSSSAFKKVNSRQREIYTLVIADYQNGLNVD